MSRTVVIAAVWVAVLTTTAAAHTPGDAPQGATGQLDAAALATGSLGAYLAGCITGLVSGAILFVGVRRKEKTATPVAADIDSPIRLAGTGVFDEESIPDETDESATPARIAA